MRWLGSIWVVLFNDSFFMACIFSFLDCSSDSLARREPGNFPDSRCLAVGRPFAISSSCDAPIAYYARFCANHLPGTPIFQFLPFLVATP